MFNLGVYLHLADPEGDARGRLEGLNRAHFTPPVSSTEVALAARSSAKKQYNYRCKQQPLAGACDRTTCLRRRFGVTRGRSDAGGGFGAYGTELRYGQLIKIAIMPPVWAWWINDARVELSTEALLNQRLLNARVLEEVSVLPKPLRPASYSDVLSRAVVESQLIVAPPDAKAEGQMWVLLRRFCTGRAVGRSLDEIILGRTWTDGGRTFFQASDFLAFLARERFATCGEGRLYAWLISRGVEHHAAVIKGRGVDFWSIPQFDEQTEPFETPRDAEAPPPL